MGPNPMWLQTSKKESVSCPPTHLNSLGVRDGRRARTGHTVTLALGQRGGSYRHWLLTWSWAASADALFSGDSHPPHQGRAQSAPGRGPGLVIR